MAFQSRGPAGRIGIVAGAGPEAGIDLWQKVLEANRQRIGGAFKGDVDAPEVVIHSVPRLGLVMDIAENEEMIWAALERSVVDLAKRCDYFAIACNILHHFSDRIAQLDLDAEFVSIVDVATDFVGEHGDGNVALLSIKAVTELGRWSPYGALSRVATIEVPGRLQTINELVREVKRVGPSSATAAAMFEGVLDELASEVVLLACTELPLIAKARPGKRLVDVSALLAEELVRRAHQHPPGAGHR